MVRITEADNGFVASVESCHHNGQVVGFRTRVDKVADLQISWHLRSQLFRIESDLWILVDSCRVLQGLNLIHLSLNNLQFGTSRCLSLYYLTCSRYPVVRLTLG